MARTFYRKLRAARRRKDLADRAVVRLTREHGVVREASVDPIATTLVRGSLADIPFDIVGLLVPAFRLVEGEFTEENGLLTPSLKVKRHAVAAAYAHEIEELYSHG